MEKVFEYLYFILSRIIPAMKLQKILLLGLGLCLPFFLIACGTNNTQELPAPNGQTINDNTYIYYYSPTCSYCRQVSEYFKRTGVDQRVNITAKNVAPGNAANIDAFITHTRELGIPNAGVPLIIVTPADGESFALLGPDSVTNHFGVLEEEIKNLPTTTDID